MSTIPELLTEEAWSDDRVAFRRKCIEACMQENLDQKEMTADEVGQAIFDIAEECFLMGEAFQGHVFTDEEMDEVNRRAERKILHHIARNPKQK